MNRFIFLHLNTFLSKATVLAVVLFAVTFTGCKPTEKGYKAAYDAAVNKRQAAVADLGVDLPKGALQQVDGPQTKKIAGMEVYYDHKRLRPVDEEMKLPGNYNVAVSVFKMPTNSKAMASDYQKEGFEAFAAKDTEGKYYTIAGSFNSQEEALELVKKLQESKKRTYVGLPDAPVIIYSAK